MKEIEAEACVGADAGNTMADPQADGGRGGKAVRLTPDGCGLSAELDLRPGLYALFTIARDPGGTTGVNLMALDVKEHATGQTRSWTLPVAYREAYFASGQMYFPAYAGGRYTVTSRLVSRLPKPPSDPSFTRWFDPATLTFSNRTVRPLLVDRLELRDVLGNCAGVAAKTRRMLTDDGELAAARKQFADSLATNKPVVLMFGRDKVFMSGSKVDVWIAQGRPAAERAARNADLWGRVPDWNDAFYNVSTTPWEAVIGHNRAGLIADAADAFEKTAHAEFGWDGAVLLCALAEKYPALDYLAQAMGGSASQTPNVGNSMPFMFNIPAGKNVYRGWSSSTMLKLARSYDQLFDFIKDNRELAAFVGTRIPWVKTPEDVVKLLDVNLLQSGMDACNRGYIEGTDLPKAMIPLVQGINPVSERMLDTGIFRAMCMNMTFRGGIQDQAVSSYSRDGVHYIGSVGYLSKDLQNIAEVLRRYRRLGGAARFDVLDERVCPQMKEADATIAQLRLAGGYRMVQGDAGDLYGQRESGVPVWPSRLLGGFGAALLESGQFQSDPLAMRGVALMFGPGRGHAHQDTLNLELFAHGCRVAPDLGGREEGKNRGRPNMRWNKVHNLVEVDGQNFDNDIPGSTVAGTGWNTGFSPQPGCQYMEHRARAASHPGVSIYARQTALVDAGDRDSYLFDVFRVRGGKVHTYCFHGGVTTNLVVNADLTPARSPTASRYLQEHFKGTQREGVVPAVLEADWPMTSAMQAHYQGAAFESNRPVTTRLTLFNHGGETLLAGNAYSDRYRYNFPFLYVRGEQSAAGRESLFPAIVEPFAGTPFITGKRLLAVTPARTGAEAAVAVEVTTTAGATDLLYASGNADLSANVSAPNPGPRTLDPPTALRASAAFAFVSRDAGGLRLAHLVGGTELDAGDVAITAERREYTATLTAVHYADRVFEIDGTLPVRLLRGVPAGIGAADPAALRHAFALERLVPAGDGMRVTHEKTACYYRSTLVNLDEAAGTVEAEIEPAVHGCDTRFIDGTVVADESGRHLWRTTFRQAERWMHLGWPGYRGSWPDGMALEDVPDADGDGRRVLKLMAGVKDGGGAEDDRVLLELEVTRVMPGRQMFYFKMPTNETYRSGGWPYVGRWLVNEDGSRRWRGSYPGTTFLWHLQGPVKDSDFADANGDGRRQMQAYLFGPGDMLRVGTSVHIRRLAEGEYEIRANVPCTVALPRGSFTRATISADGKSFAPLGAREDGHRLHVTLGESELADGRITLRLLD